MSVNKIGILLCFLGLVSCSVVAQHQVSGTLLNDAGDPVPGATLVIKGSSTGTITDAEGNYKLAIPSGIDNLVLVINYVGHNTLEVDASSRRSRELNFGSFQLSMEFGLICEDGYTYTSDILEDYSLLFFPFSGQKRILLKSIKKKERKLFSARLDSTETIAKERFAQLWYCLLNKEPCKKEIREDHQFLTGELYALTAYLKEARANIKEGASPASTLSRLPQFTQRFAKYRVYKCVP